MKIMRTWVVYSLLMGLLLASCGAGEAEPITATPSASHTALPSATSTASLTPTQTATPTLTPEPEWYEPLHPRPDDLEYSYAEVVNEKARVYVSLEDAIARNGNFGTLPFFPAYVAVISSETRDGRTYHSINYGWLDAADLQMLTPSPFSGLLLTRPIPFRFGWLIADAVSVNSSGTPIREYKRHQVIHEVAEAGNRDGFIAVGPDEWLPGDQVALVEPQDAGQGNCRFIYVNLAEQTLVVVEGCQPIFATLVSSGRNSWTFTGSFSLQRKVGYATIQAPSWSTSEYYMQAVPYFMNYDLDFGFHGAYWHDDFGIAASHGCINLSPADAHWLFDWAGVGDRVVISTGN